MFRDTVLQERADKLEGVAVIAVPIAWQTIGYLLLASIVSLVIFLSSANYSRIESAKGMITPDKGVSSMFPIRSGTIVEVGVIEGQLVKAGHILVQIRTELDSGQDLSFDEKIERAIARQDESLVSQIEAANVASEAQLSQLTVQQTGYQLEIEKIHSQITLQQNLVEIAQADFDRALEAVEEGFVSQRDLQIREETLLLRQQSLAQLNQTLTGRQSALAESEGASIQIAAQARVTEANLTAARAQLKQRAASTEGSRSYVIRAPIAGTVTALTARIGQSVNSGTQLLSIVPEGSELQAQLAVQSSAIGFIEPGQRVSLAIDAFPYQRFGTVEGQVLTVAESTLSQQWANGAVVSVYLVRVHLDTPFIIAFGRKEPLLPGMTLNARIVTENQSLLEWLFEPLYAVQRR